MCINYIIIAPSAGFLDSARNDVRIKTFLSYRFGKECHDYSQKFRLSRDKAMATMLSTLKELRGIGDTTESVPDDFFDTFFFD